MITTNKQKTVNIRKPFDDLTYKLVVLAYQPTNKTSKKEFKTFLNNIKDNYKQYDYLLMDIQGNFAVTNNPTISISKVCLSIEYLTENKNNINYATQNWITICKSKLKGA